MGKKKIIITTGGTAGHLVPACELARRLGALSLPPEVLFAGGKLSRNPFFDKALPHRDLPAATFSLRRPLKAMVVAWGVVRAWLLLRSFRPDCVVGFGSFHTFPLLMAAALRKVPIVLHEGNAYPGRVTRFFSAKAAFTGVQFKAAGKRLKGSVRLVEVTRQPTAFLPKKEKKTLLVFGGSQGAKQLNEIVTLALKRLKPNLHVIHLTGDPSAVGPVAEAYAKSGISARVAPFEKEMDRAWQVADLAICRAGAATCGEQIAFKCPAIMIPYPFATDDHQDYNAAELAKGGGVVKVSEASLTSDALQRLLEGLLSGVRLSEMKQSIQSDDREDFAAVVAEVAGCLTT